MTPEDIGLTGCWQIVLIFRERVSLAGGQEVKKVQEYGYYVTSLTKEESSAREVLEAARSHWSAIENGSHYRRDKTLGEDASRISGRSSAHAMATMRNLAIGLFELCGQSGRRGAGTLAEFVRRMTFRNALRMLRTGAY